MQKAGDRLPFCVYGSEMLVITFTRLRLVEHKSKNVKVLETAISQGLASVVDLEWPSRRWPIHVFTAGAMICLATSTLCHLFGSVGYKQAQARPLPLPTPLWILFNCLGKTQQLMKLPATQRCHTAVHMPAMAERVSTKCSPSRILMESLDWSCHVLAIQHMWCYGSDMLMSLVCTRYVLASSKST